MTPRASTLQLWSDLAEKSAQVIEDNLHDPEFRLSDAARTLDVSTRTLQRALAHNRADFSGHLFTARMTRAARLMASGRFVINAAAQCGYRSVPHFVTTFGAVFGVTPAKFRRAQKLQDLLAYRVWKDKVDSVPTTSREHRKRRRKWADNQRELKSIVNDLTPRGSAALAALKPAERWYISPERMQEIRAEQDRRRKERRQRQAERMARRALYDDDSPFGRSGSVTEAMIEEMRDELSRELVTDLFTEV